MSVPAKVTLPLYMRIGEDGTDQLVGRVSWDADTGKVSAELSAELSRLRPADPHKPDDSGEPQGSGPKKDRRGGL